MKELISGEGMEEMIKKKFVVRESVKIGEHQKCEKFNTFTDRQKYKNVKGVVLVSKDPQYHIEFRILEVKPPSMTVISLRDRTAFSKFASLKT